MPLIKKSPAWLHLFVPALNDGQTHTISAWEKLGVLNPLGTVRN